MLDHHDRRVRHVDADFDHRRRDQHVDLAAHERVHRRRLFVGFHPAVQQPDAQSAAQRPRVRDDAANARVNSSCSATAVCSSSFSDSSISGQTQYTCRRSAQALPDPVDDLRAPLLADETRRHRRAARWHFIERRNVEIGVERHRERARDRRCAHHQLMRFGESLAAQRKPLRDAEAMLLVDDREAELRHRDAFLEQRVRADRERRLAARQRLQRLAPLLRGQRAGQPRDLDADAAEPTLRACGNAARRGSRSAP